MNNKYQYTVNNDQELHDIFKKIMSKDKGAYVMIVTPKGEFPATVETNIKIKNQVMNTQPISSNEDSTPEWLTKDTHFLVLPNIPHRDGISEQWIRLWDQIENWYGDIEKRETGAEFLKRMQSHFALSLTTPSPSSPEDSWLASDTWPFFKTSKGKWFYCYKDLQGLNQHSKLFDSREEAFWDYTGLVMCKPEQLDSPSSPVSDSIEQQKHLSAEDLIKYSEQFKTEIKRLKEENQKLQKEVDGYIAFGKVVVEYGSDELANRNFDIDILKKENKRLKRQDEELTREYIDVKRKLVQAEATIHEMKQLKNKDNGK